MRALAACTGLVLLVPLSGCGDDSATTTDGPAIDRVIDAPMPDAAAGPDKGVTVVRHLGILDAGAADDGGFFDFTGDGVPDNVLSPLSILNTSFQNAICPNSGPCQAGGLRILGRIDSLDDPINDTMISVDLFHAFDADSDPNNDFNGSGAFLLDPLSLSGGNPVSTLMMGHISGGTLFAEANGELALQFGFVTLRFVRGRLRAHLDQQGNATSLSGGIIAGVIPACTAKNIMLPSPVNASLLDFLTNKACSMGANDAGVNCQNDMTIQPDIDLNGNGTLETFTNDFGTVTACSDGSLTVVDPDCPCDSRFNGGDGWSVSEFFDSLPARIAGVAPPPDGGSP